MRVIKFERSLARKILEGYKKCTLRREPYKEGEIVVIKVGNQVIAKAKIVSVKKVKLKEITRDIVLAEGFYSKEALLNKLRKIYGNLCEEDELYLICFELIEETNEKSKK